MLSKFVIARGALALLLVAAGTAAPAVPVSTFTVSGAGFTSVDKGVTRTPFDIVESILPGGGGMTTGGGYQEVRVQGSSAVILASAGGSGKAFAQPGTLGAAVHGIASVADTGGESTLGGHVEANFGVRSTEYIPITSNTLPIGSLVDFTASFHIDGITSSERPPPFNGPYHSGGFSGYDTGTFFFIFTAFTVNGITESYNNDAVSSGTYSFPNGVFQSVPTALNFGQTYNMQGKVGDFLVLHTQLGLGVNDRGNQESHLDFSNTVNLYADAVTPGLRFIGNGHNYASITAVPVPAGAVLMLSALAVLRGSRRRPY